MSEEDKEYYKAKAKGGEVRIPKPGRVSGAGGGGNGKGGLTSQGIPIALIEQEERQRKRDDEKMRRRIGAMIQNNELMTGTYKQQQKQQSKDLLPELHAFHIARVRITTTDIH